MDSLFILNPEGNNGNGRITGYVGRGRGIREHIALIDTIIDANREALEIVSAAREEGQEFADISEPAHAAAAAKAALVMQAANN